VCCNFRLVAVAVVIDVAGALQGNGILGKGVALRRLRRARARL